MNWQCPVCGTEPLYGDEHVLCPKHQCELFPYEATAGPDDQGEADTGRADPEQPVTRAALRWDRSTCWNCATAPPDAGNTECLHCHRSLTPPGLLIRFQYGEVAVDPGARAELGRIGKHGRVFRSYLNVSRRHAVVGVDPDGGAWVEPLPTPNGTFLDGTEVPASVRQPIHNGQLLRFALHAEGIASVFTGEDTT
jgi:hypothetical protein